MSDGCKKTYITTPIYYVNDVPHIGHAYTTIIADTMARYTRMIGYDAFFLTGTDEHGQKIELAAKQRGKSPKSYADEISGKFKALWDEFDISYDKFIRTTDENHKIGVQKAFEKMYQKGDIYKDEYEGHYCISCETFFTETQLVDGGFCPDCGKETSLVKEESYFFKLSSYEEKLLKWYEDEEKCVLPKGKKNEVVAFVKQGLKDLSVTRTSFDWGVKLPKSINDPKHVMYVWLDALMNYLTALGYGTDEKNMEFWPARVHIVGKDILRFHAIYWPAFLMSLDLPLPKHIASHGWWTRNGEKMSKSKGNVVDPKEVADAYGLENFRYFMLREVPFGQDGDFSQKALIDRINSDLGNELGNLLNRIIGMSGKYFDFEIRNVDVKKYYDSELKKADKIIKSLPEYLYNMQTNRYLEELWKVLTIANQSIATYEPWVKMKEGKEDEAMALVALVANLLAKVSVMLSPVMPKTCETISDALGIKNDTKHFKSLIEDGDLLKDFKVKKVPPLFPKIEEELIKNESKKEEEPKEKKRSEPKKEEGIITIDQFLQTSLKIGTIIEAKEVKKSNRLLLLKVDLGEENPRQIVAGIKEFYKLEELVNTQVCVVANLKPAKLMGMLSEGMLLAAKDKNGLSLLRPESPKEVGTKVS
jgi:methionyl-tRNA synthetase